MNNNQRPIISNNNQTMKFSKTLFFFIFTFSLLNAKAQEKLTIKSTESYTLEMPLTYGDFKHQDVFRTWNFDFKNKKITYQDFNNKINTFYFSSMELNQNSTDEKSIVHFENSKENITLIVKNGNYIKIQYSTNKEPNTNPASYKTIRVYTNYVINEFTDLLSH